MIVANTPFTPEQLLALPDSQGLEIVRGQLVEHQMGAEENEIGGVVLALLFNHCRRLKFGRIYPETAYRCFPHDPTMVRKPDVSVLSYKKWPANRKLGSYITVPPDLAVEVVSPNDTYQEVREKVADYLQAQIPLIWVVNESTRQVEVYFKEEVKILSHDDELTGGDVIPGFSCLVSEIFADIPTEK